VLKCRLVLVTWGTHTIKGSLAVSSELVMLGKVLRSVLVELKEACGVVVNIGVAKVVKLVTQSVLDELFHLRSVLFLVDIKLSGCGFELVGRGCR